MVARFSKLIALIFLAFFCSGISSHPSRKLFDPVNINTRRTGEDCAGVDNIQVYQAQTAPLPNGIPTYTVQVVNLCDKCSIGNIHISCGWYSSARLVNPKIFRRLGHNDCLVNDGRPIGSGQTVSFQYANTFRYPMTVSSASCV